MIRHRFIVGAWLCFLLASGAIAQGLSAEAALDARKPLTRAEVIADFRLWQRAGLGQFENPHLREVFPEAYQKALERYFKLRQGQAFVEEVLRVSSESD